MAWRARPWSFGLIAVLLVSSVSTTLLQAQAATRRWRTSGPLGGSVFEIALHPQDQGVLLIGTHHGLYRSADGGRAWNRLGRGLPRYQAVNSPTYAPSDPSRVYAVVGSNRNDMFSQSGIYRSDDGGATWSRPDVAVDVGGTATIAVHPLDPDSVYAGTGGETYHSIDGGLNWTRLKVGVDSRLPSESLKISPSDPDVIYAVAHQPYRSDDGGATWEDLDNTYSDIFRSVAVHPTDPMTVYFAAHGGIYKSSDGGDTIVPVKEFLFGAVDVGMDPARPSTVYAATTNRGVLKSDDSGATWRRAGRLPRDKTTIDIDIDPHRSGGVYVSYWNHGLYRSVDGGEHWRNHNRGLIGTGILDVELDAVRQDRIYAAVGHLGIFVSRDGGASWHHAAFRHGVVNNIEVHPRRAGYVYAATSKGLFRSKDGARTWKRIDREIPEPPLGTRIALSPSRPRVLYFGNYLSIYRSVNAGKAWRRITDFETDIIFDLKVHPKRPRVVLSAMSVGLMRTGDGGKTWRELGRFDSGRAGPLRGLAFDPHRPRIIYGTNSSGIYKTGDAGRAWKLVTGSDFPRSWPVIVDPSRPRQVFAGGFGYDSYGIYRSTDRGKTWKLFSDGLRTGWIGSLAIRRDGTKLYAGTSYGLDDDDGTGVARRRI